MRKAERSADPETGAGFPPGREAVRDCLLDAARRLACSLRAQTRSANATSFALLSVVSMQNRTIVRNVIAGTPNSSLVIPVSCFPKSPDVESVSALSTKLSAVDNKFIQDDRREPTLY